MIRQQNSTVMVTLDNEMRRDTVPVITLLSLSTGESSQCCNTRESGSNTGERDKTEVTCRAHDHPRKLQQSQLADQSEFSSAARGKSA